MAAIGAAFVGATAATFISAGAALVDAGGAVGNPQNPPDGADACAHGEQWSRLVR